MLNDKGVANSLCTDRERDSDRATSPRRCGIRGYNIPHFYAQKVSLFGRNPLSLRIVQSQPHTHSYAQNCKYGSPYLQLGQELAALVAAQSLRDGPTLPSDPPAITGFGVDVGHV
jgi:hypothetical protein